jgi:hypothetical protein
MLIKDKFEAKLILNLSVFINYLIFIIKYETNSQKSRTINDNSTFN